MFGAQALMSLGGALIGAQSQANQSIQQYNQRVYAANAEADAINRSTVFTYAMNNLKASQVENQADVEEEQARGKLYAATGEARAAAASGGVTGNSVAALLESYRIATGKDLSGIRSNAEGEAAQTQAENKGAQLSAKNQIFGLKEGIGIAPNTSSTMVSSMISGALGVGKAFVDNTTPIKNGTGGLFGSGGFLGIGRQFG
jgi:hypothetical protein